MSACLAIAIVSLAAAVCAPSALADFGVQEFSGEVLNRDGTPATQAGAHPFSASTTIKFNSHDVNGQPVPDADVRDITVDLPAGFIGNPNATPKCPQQELYTSDQLDCSPATQVGWAQFGLTDYLPLFNIYSKVYSMEPPEGVPAQFAMNLTGLIVVLNAQVRDDGTYGLTINVPNISQLVGIVETRLTFWGVPADRAHDEYRGICLTTNIGPIGIQCPTDVPRRAFLTNPSNCDAGPLTTSLRASPWADRSIVARGSFDHDVRGNAMEVENCDVVPFEASLDARPVSQVAGAPSGYVFDVNIPQDDNPDGLATAPMKKAVVKLPEGVRVSPSAAGGLEGCADEEFRLRSAGDARCSDGSKVGTLRIDTPLLSRPLDGSIYLGRPLPGQLLRIFLVARGQGVTVKIPGSVNPDPNTGQLSAIFDNNPQLPFSNLHLEFKGGPRASLSNPPVQGTYTTVTELTSWSGKTVTSNSTFNITQGPRSLVFAPKLTAGSTDSKAGKSTGLSFKLGFSRTDGDEEFNGLTVNMPKGLLARLAGRTLCSEAQAAAGTCGEGSRVGSVTTAAGAGTNPFALPGRVYIGGPYKGAPFGLSIVVPAVAGPFDLGTVVVRAAIHVDPITTELRIVSDPLPRILEGIPLQIRLVDVSIDQPNFMINPTSCAVMNVAAQLSSTLGKIANVANRFRATDCALLPFRPRMRLTVGDRTHTRGGDSTPVSATLNMPVGNANNRAVQVILPKTLAARLEVLNVRKACTFEQFKAERCPINVGSAVAVTPVLRDPLKGSVYLVRHPARRLPDVMVALKGQGDAKALSIDVTGKVTIPRDLRIRTTFDTVPDAPITMFRLNFRTGRNAPIAAVDNLCTARARRESIAELAFVAQSGKRASARQRINIAGCRGTSSGRRAAGRRGRRSEASNRAR
ncbi:hypothetical protein Cwoe_5342 [Conexibacter woesei DSM 14684]|uniref:Uncharacterized protein n=1 Tax=Conexibacter woesei (strain DSM 14684 / CCUG 47730 / CIP 108061 / JCM 11494 / NBRC 100937 / ID131577) TaxID=469383 RepID=D3FFF5_CONWI|nr:hypothetical protein Cwoe_5342 [Conexibacter woesei DSM 14684]